MEKKELRKALLAQRNGLNPEERSERSRRAQQNLIASDWFREADLVLLYLPFRGEAETALLARAARESGKRLALPRVQREPKKLWLHLWTGEPVVGAYGIMEPAPDWPLVEPAEVGLAVVAGVGFDQRGYRLGYGGGYYDRTLPLLTRAVKVGLAFDLQVVEQLPVEPHDIRLDGVATEAGLLVCREGGAPGR